MMPSERRNAAEQQAPIMGVLEWFRPQEYEHVEQVLQDMRETGVTYLRTGVSWADWHTPNGREWYEWLLPRLASEVDILPCFHYTPPSLGVEPRTAAPPRRPQDFADFLDQMITEFGGYFDWVEIWNEPNNLNDWDWRLDPGWLIFCEMAGAAAYWAKQRGKRTLLGGPCPLDTNWLRRLCQRGLIEHMDAIGIHGFPGTWDFSWTDWTTEVARARRVFEEYGLNPAIWITEAGFSTWKFNEFEQVECFADTLKAPVERVYWYAARDLPPDVPTQDGLLSDKRHYHMGLKHSDGAPKLLHRWWAEGGIEKVQEAAQLYKRPVHAANSDSQPPVLITGGAGFVGANLAHRLLSSGQPVLILDNLSRPGVELNLKWLRQNHGDLVQIHADDVRNRYRLSQALRDASHVFHFAAQVAVTTSTASPYLDFEINAQGTLNLLEEMRALDNPPPLLFTSTNKVYGALENIALQQEDTRYAPSDPEIQHRGVDERQPLDFYSPYGCSKGVADQYVLDFARTYGMTAAVFRMSCIYGPRQFGTEDQGWVAHFLIQALKDEQITLYGDGLQVRDILFIDDLVDAFMLAKANMPRISGQAFNIGGGPPNAVSLLELLELIGGMHCHTPRVSSDAWRPGDQRYYVSDYAKLSEAVGWRPKVSVREGIAILYQWLRDEVVRSDTCACPATSAHIS